MSTEGIFREVESTIDELTQQAEKLISEAEATINAAYSINERVVNRSDDYVPLDDQPYGEELIRTEGMVESLGIQIGELEQARDEENLAKAVDIVQAAERALNEHQETFEDCFHESFVAQAQREDEVW